jgi:hypothetical protein
MSEQADMLSRIDDTSTTLSTEATQLSELLARVTDDGDVSVGASTAASPALSDVTTTDD